MENNKKIWLLAGLLAFAILIIVLIAFSPSRRPAPFADAPSVPTTPISAVEQADNEVAPSKGVISSEAVTPESLQEARSVAVGTSLITEDLKVVTPAGEPVKLNVQPSAPEAPKESAPIASADAVADDAYTVKLSVSSAGFVPDTFTVKSGQLVNFVLTSTDDFTHVFVFDDKALLATALGVAGGETRVKSWNAPAPGEYTFRCDVPGHKNRGEVGTMIVQ